MGKQSGSKKKKKQGEEGKNDIPEPRLSFGKKLAFSFIAVAIFLLILEGALLLVGYKPFTASDPYVGFQSKIPLFVPDQDKEGNAIYRTADNKRNHFNLQSFPAKKAKGAFRIFTLGGSTTYGHPYTDSTSFSGWLREFLRAADPNRQWEVINCGGISYASYRAAALMEELGRYEPDLFIVYSGHNEFLERRTYSGIIEEPEAVTKLKLLFGNLRTYSFLMDAKGRALEGGEKKEKASTRLQGEVSALLDNSAGPDIYHRDDALKDQVLSHYRFNLNRMAQLASSSGAKIIFVTTPVNEKDFSPFKSQHGKEMPEGEAKEYETALARAVEKIDQGLFGEAAETLKIFAAKDDRYASAHYELGRTLFGQKKYEEAKREFARAVDEDICPLRAMTPVDTIIRDVAKKNGAPLVDFTRMLESGSQQKRGHAILGEEDFLDHVHPTIEANRILGKELLNTLAGMKVVSLPSGWGEEKVREVAAKVEAGIDATAHAQAEKILARVLIWAGKRKEAVRFAQSAAGVLEDDPESQFHRAFSLEEEGKYEEAITAYRGVIGLNRDYLKAYNNLTLLLIHRGKEDEALRILEDAVKRFPGSAEIFNNYGMALQKKTRVEEAVRAFEKSLELDRHRPHVHANLGIAYSALSLFYKAAESFREALKLNPEEPEARRYLGLALAAMGNCKEAIFHFEQVLKADPGNQRIEEYIQRCREEMK